MRRKFFSLLGCLGILLLGGCGLQTAPMPDVAIHVGELEGNVTGLTLWVLPPNYAGSATTCQALLDRSATFDAEVFNEKKATSVIIPIGQQQMVQSTINQLQPGDYLFVVGGYSNNSVAPENLRYMGCQSGTVEVGKKTALSIFLALVRS